MQNLHRPAGSACRTAISRSLRRRSRSCAAVSRDIPNLGPRISIVDHRQADWSFWRHGGGDRAWQVLSAAWSSGRFSRRCLCRRGFLDRMAANLSRSAAPAQPSLSAEVRKGRVILPRGQHGSGPFLCPMFARRCADHLRGRFPAEDSYPAVSGSRAQKPCKGDVPRVWLKGSSCLCLLVGTQPLPSGLCWGSPALIAQSSSKRTAS